VIVAPGHRQTVTSRISDPWSCSAVTLSKVGAVSSSRLINSPKLRGSVVSDRPGASLPLRRATPRPGDVCGNLHLTDQWEHVG